jgi:hypothetical protein
MIHHIVIVSECHKSKTFLCNKLKNIGLRNARNEKMLFFESENLNCLSYALQMIINMYHDMSDLMRNFHVNCSRMWVFNKLE